MFISMIRSSESRGLPMPAIISVLSIDAVAHLVVVQQIHQRPTFANDCTNSLQTIAQTVFK
ncbi:MAG: hypothetical protein OSA47_10925, partial [Novosphingopyxis baekryungensis]|nr:hypothetical protein [Novosphingopyxis baekryungensis]